MMRKYKQRKMIIVHKLKKENNYSFYLKCPKCGKDFDEHKIKKLENLTKQLTSGVKQIECNELIVEDYKDNPYDEFEFNCKDCNFTIKYLLENKIKIIKK